MIPEQLSREDRIAVCREHESGGGSARKRVSTMKNLRRRLPMSLASRVRRVRDILQFGM
jgi:hypothetical protein